MLRYNIFILSALDAKIWHAWQVKNPAGGRITQNGLPELSLDEAKTSVCIALIWTIDECLEQVPTYNNGDWGNICANAGTWDSHWGAASVEQDIGRDAELISTEPCILWQGEKSQVWYPAVSTRNLPEKKNLSAFYLAGKQGI